MTSPGVLCSYCGRRAELVDSSIVYGRDYGKIWLCKCIDGWAYVGAHKETGEPLGTLAGAELREARKKAHRTLDPLWNLGEMTRTGTYRWLADAMGLELKDCHIGLFNVEQCHKVVELAAAKRGAASTEDRERDILWTRAIVSTLSTKEAEAVLRAFNKLIHCEVEEGS